MHLGRIFAAVVGVVTTCAVSVAVGQMRVQSPNQPPALEETPTSQPGATPPAPTESQSQTKEKLARVWANEPPLVRLARDKFGAELTETDAKFFAAVSDSKWADLRPSSDTKYDPQEPASWKGSAKLRADRLVWLFTDSAAVKCVPSRGVWIRGLHIQGKIDLYRCDVPFALAFYDCLFDDGLSIGHAKIEELDIRNCCSAGIQARGVQIAENVYLLTTCVFGGLDFIDAQIGGDVDFGGGLAFHGISADDVKKPGVAINFHDAKIAGDLKLHDKFRAIGQVRLISTQIGHSLCCQNGRFASVGGQAAIDARSAHIANDIQFMNGFRAEGTVDISQAHIGGELDCSGGRFTAPTEFPQALAAESVNVGGQINLGEGFQAEGEVRLVNAVVGSDINCNNGHFIYPAGNSLSLDGATIGRSLRMATARDASAASSKTPPNFLARGTVSLCGAQISQDLIAGSAQFEAPTSAAIMASNVKVGGRVDLTCIKAQGSINLSSADIERELDLRCGQIDGKGAPNKIAFWANGMHVRGHVFCNQVETPEGLQRLRVTGLTSFQFATIAMHWDLTGAQFINPEDYAIDASDCRVGGYVNLDHVAIDGSATFSRAKIDGMWILLKPVDPQKMRLDLRFAHIWVIKDESLSDWPPAGHLQLEGLVYDHFDDDSPLDVNDRLAWLRRQYAPIAKSRKSKPGQVPSTTPLQAALHSRIDRNVVPTQYESSSMPAQMPAPVSTPMPLAVQTEPDAEAQARKQMAEAAEKEKVAEAEAEGMKAPEAEVDPPADETEAKSEDTPHAPEEIVDPAGRRYITQPYTQLASVYRAIGQDEQANAVLVARAERLGELAPTFSAHGLWYRYLGRLIGYGYEPFRAIKIGLVIVIVGTLVFALGAHRGLMSETNLAERVLSREDESGVVSPTYPRFNALVYSLDVFLPFVDLNQVGYWIPGEKPTIPRTGRNCLMHIGRYSLKWSSVLHGYLWFQTLAGWTLCTLLAAAVTGIVQS